jgi:hexosaminidase
MIWYFSDLELNQLLEDAHDQSVKIPPCKITDYPKIACRAVHLDLKSHLDAGYYYYKIIDQLAGIKVNTIILEFEDKLRYRKAKEVGAPNAISVKEFIEISKYAKDRNIEISPLVIGIG